MLKSIITIITGILVTSICFGKVDILNTKHVPGELIVKLKENNFAPNVVLLSGERAKSFRASGAHLFKFPSVIDLQKVANELESHPSVEYVELNAIHTLQSTPNDPRFSELYGLHNEGQTGGTAGADINALEAWNETKGSRDILVGVIDTGIDYNHPDLIDNVWTNPGESGLDAEGNDKKTNGIDDDGNGYIDDFRGWDFIGGDNDPLDGNGHGTHVSGTIGAVGNNEVGVVGVSWEVSLVGLKIFSDEGSTTTESIVEAIEYSTTLGVDVTNNSWGGGPRSETMLAAIEEANRKEILFIAAAGNSFAGQNNDNIDFYPANYEVPNVIAVAAVDHNDNLASFSHYGLKTVDIAAPGVDVLSTLPDNTYDKFSGTSMATPHVTGLVVLVKSKFPEASVQQLRSRIINTGSRVPALAAKVGSGRRINAVNALEIDTIAPSTPLGLAVLETGISSVRVSWDPSGDDGLDGVAEEYEVRLSENLITEDNWDSATRIDSSIVEKGETTVSANLEGLAFNSSGYIAVKALDNLGNSSFVSESLSYSTRTVALAYQETGDSLSNFSVNGPWGIEEVDGVTFISDSPGGTYNNKINVSIESEEIELPHSESTMVLRTSYNIETRYDFAYFEISVDSGETWIELDKFSGFSDWAVLSYDLSPHIEGVSSFSYRFRLDTDDTVNQDGIRIDNIAIIHPMD